jgi:hypothetical protein
MWPPVKCVPTFSSSLRIELRENVSRISHEVAKQEAMDQKKGRTRELVERREEEEEGEDTDWKMRSLLAYFPYFEKKK